MTTNKLTAAIAAIRAGDKSSGRQLLFEIVKEEPSNETAWLWLSVCVDNVEQKKYSLSQALAINPGNQNARKALAQLEQPQQPSVEDIIFRPISKPKIPEESILPPPPIVARPDPTITSSSPQKPDKGKIIEYILLTLVIVLACSVACIFSIKFLLHSSTNVVSSSSNNCDNEGIQKIKEALVLYGKAGAEFSASDWSQVSAAHILGNMTAYRDVVMNTQVSDCAQHFKELTISAIQEGMNAMSANIIGDYSSANRYLTNSSKILDQVSTEYDRIMRCMPDC